MLSSRIRAFVFGAALFPLAACGTPATDDSPTTRSKSTKSTGTEGNAVTCTGDKVSCDNECIDPISLDMDGIHKSILAGSCALSGCHGDAKKEGIFLTTAQDAYDSLVSAPSHQILSTLLVKPGQPGASYLMNKLTGMGMSATSSTGGSTARMPRGGNALCQPKLDAIEAWITAGAAR